MQWSLETDKMILHSIQEIAEVMTPSSIKSQVRSLQEDYCLQEKRDLSQQSSLINNLKC